MKQLTDKQRAFVANKAAGVPNREAAIAAGYAPNSADVAAAKLSGRADIKAAIKAATSGNEAPGDANSMPREKYTEPMAFLMDVMNHPKLPIGMRADAAKQLLPYHHARIGEMGKKESAIQQAKDVIGNTRSKFSPLKPPSIMRVIPGGKDE